jgi:hypothetical protein
VTLAKDDSVTSVLERLRQDLGPAAFEVVDHWDYDLCAFGVARPDDHRYLVYISTWPPARGLFNYECERPSTTAEAVYDSDGMIEGATYDELRAAVRTHVTA